MTEKPVCLFGLFVVPEATLLNQPPDSRLSESRSLMSVKSATAATCIPCSYGDTARTCFVSRGESMRRTASSIRTATVALLAIAISVSTAVALASAPLAPESDDPHNPSPKFVMLEATILVKEAFPGQVYSDTQILIQVEDVPLGSVLGSVLAVRASGYTRTETTPSSSRG